MEAAHVIIRPVISEQSMKEAGNGRYTFVVARDADKTAIKRAIQDLYKVHVTSVTTVTVKGKTKRVGVRRNEVVITPLKKAIASVKKGEKIGVFDIAA